MLSLLSRTFVVSKSGIPGPTISCLPTVWRFFSQSHVKCAAPEDPEARRKRLDRINERFRQRYHNDHDFRKKMLSYMHAKRHSDDPVQREHGINLMKQCVDRWRTRHPEAWAESQRKYRLVQAARYANDPRHAFLKKLRRWLVYHADHADAVEDLPWRAHVPVFYGEKILRRCAGRDRLSHLGNFKLWWELRKDSSKQDADEYLCHSCYVPRENWQDALPQGCKDSKSMIELIDCKNRFASSDHGSQSVRHTKCK